MKNRILLPLALALFGCGSGEATTAQSTFIPTTGGSAGEEVGVPTGGDAGEPSPTGGNGIAGSPDETGGETSGGSDSGGTAGEPPTGGSAGEPLTGGDAGTSTTGGTSGEPSTGGTTPTGGTAGEPSTGGSAPTGGSPTGGSAGVTSTGGSTPTGGSPTGGSTPTGGSPTGGTGGTDPFCGCEVTPDGQMFQYTCEGTSTPCPLGCLGVDGHGCAECVPSSPPTCTPEGVVTCVDRMWSDPTPCPFACHDGACIGSCVPGTRDCNGLTPRVCNDLGEWENEPACPYVCDAGTGTCSGECIPGTKTCTTGPVGTKTCGTGGYWEPVNVCPTSTGEVASCSNGTCSTSCRVGKADCTSAPGCETTLGTTSNCLGCGDVCTTPTNGSASCTATGCEPSCNETWDNCDGNPATCEQDVWNDPENCGGCGISCYGATCDMGVCSQEIELLANLDARVNDIDVVGGDLYYATDNEVGVVGVDGSNPELLFSEGAEHVVTDGTTLIRIESNGEVKRDDAVVHTIRLDWSGGTYAGNPRQVGFDGTTIYWTDQDSSPDCSSQCSSNVYRMPLTGSPSVYFTTTTEANDVLAWAGPYGTCFWNHDRDSFNCHQALINDGNTPTDVYAITYQDPYIIASTNRGLVRYTGGNPGVRLGSSGNTTHLEADASHVYYGFGYSAQRIGINGGTPETVTPYDTDNQVTAIALDDSHFYWAVWDMSEGTHRIFRTPI